MVGYGNMNEEKLDIIFNTKTIRTNDLMSL